MPVRRRRAALLSALLASAACDDDPELIVVEGELIDIKYEPEFQLCEGTLAAYERGIASTAEQLGLDVADLGPMSISWVARSRFVDEVASYQEDFAGRAYRGEALSVLPYMFHEVVHLVADSASGVARPFLSEGLATAFEEKIVAVDLVDPRSVLGARRLTTPSVDYYETSGQFVSYLLGRYGPERFWELYGDFGVLSSERKFRRRFSAIYSRDLDDEVEEYLRGECPEDALPIPLPPSCAAEEIPWGDDGVWTYARALDCSVEDVAGGLGGEYPGVQIEHSVTFVIDEPGDYEVRRIGARDLYAIVYRCGGCPWLNSPSYVTSRYFAAGRYSLRFVSGEREGASIGLSIKPRVPPPAPVSPP